MKKITYANIEAERLKHGLSKKELSQAIGVTSRSYYNYIHGKVPIPSKVLLNLSNLFNSSIDYLLS